MISSYTYAIVFLFILFSNIPGFTWDRNNPADPPYIEESDGIFSNKDYVVSEGKPRKNTLKLKKTIEGSIRPKSVVHSGNGLFFAQNMMYRHTITVYNRSFKKIKTISDKVNLSDYDLPGYSGEAEGAPVEVAFSPDKKIAWVSNYKMYGDQFNNPGQDNCPTSPDYDQSFIYKVNTQTLQIESLIEVGCVPKYVAATPDGKHVLVTNWCSGDLSVIDTRLEKEIERIPLGRYPRGIVVDSKSRYAYVSIMGSTKIAQIKLSDYSLTWINDVGKTPRHLCLSPSGRYLYVTLSREGQVAKIDLVKRKIIKTVETGDEARSMVITPGGRYLYVVNYEDNSISKVDAENMNVLSTIETNEKPIGITFDPENSNVWVACYSGSIMIFEDEAYHPPIPEPVDPRIAGPVAPSKEKDFGILFTPKTEEEKKKDDTYFLYKDKPLEQKERMVQSPQNNNKNDFKDLNSIEEDKSTRSINKNKKPEKSLGSLTPPKMTSSSKYHLIVGSYSARENALIRIRKLKLQGFKSPSIIPSEDGKYRVSCEYYNTRLKAEKAKENLMLEKKIDAWILDE